MVADLRVLTGRIRAISLILGVCVFGGLSCTEVEPLPPCETAENCPDEEICLNGICVPEDPCGAGIYRVEDEVPLFLSVSERANPFVIRSRSPDPESFASVIAPQGDRQLRIEPAGQPRLFESDFYVPDGSGDDRNTAVFVEAKLRLVGPGGPCQGTIEMRVPTLDQNADPFVQARFCVGEGAFGPSGGGPTEQVIEGIDLSEFHVFRIEYTRPAVNLDAGAEDSKPRFDIYIDGVKQDVTYLAEEFVNGVALDRDAVGPRDTYIRFGGEEGTSVWDFVRWGCVSASGVCLPKMNENDERPGTIEDDFTPNNSADRERPGICSERRLTNGPCDSNTTGRSSGPEICDDSDNDCDGNTDENYKGTAEGGDNVALTFYAFPEQAASPEEFPEAEPDMFQSQLLNLGDECGIGACQSAQVECNPQYFDNPSQFEELFCDVENDPNFRRQETCNETDDDCDGYIDENYRRFAGRVLPYPGTMGIPEDPDKRPFRERGDPLYKNEVCSLGLCANVRVTCDVTGAPPTFEAECNVEASRQPEVCGNRVDDDCDGTVDETGNGRGQIDLDNDDYPECDHCLLTNRFRRLYPEFLGLYPEDTWLDQAPEEAQELFEDIVDAMPSGVTVLGAGSAMNPEDLFDIRLCFANPDEDPLEREDPPAGYDCDDTVREIFEGADELCDLRDNDCDEKTDETDRVDQQNTAYNEACVGPAETNNTERICDGLSARCSNVCLVGFDDVDDNPNDCEIPVYIDQLAECDDGGANTQPVRNGTTGRYARDPSNGQLVDGSGSNLRCSERCNGLDDDGDGRTDEAFGLVLRQCYSGPPATNPAFNDLGPNTACNAGTFRCAFERYDESVCNDEVLPSNEICDGLDNDCDGEVDEDFITAEESAEDLQLSDPGKLARFDCTQQNTLTGPCREAYFRCLPGGAEADVGFRVPEGRSLTVNQADSTICIPEVKPFTLQETCNGTDENGTLLSVLDAPEIDEDCDGITDEDAGAALQEGRRIYPFPTNCGACGVSCIDRGDELNYRQECVPSGLLFRCSDICVDGRVDANDDDTDGCECIFQDPEDENSRVAVCDDDVPNGSCDVPCDAATALAGMCTCGEVGQGLDEDIDRSRCGEVCDGLDDDCDGRIDERKSLLTGECYSIGQNDQTVNVGLCQRGRRACEAGDLAPVRPAQVDEADIDDGRFLDEDQDGCIDEITPVVEECDGLDNDCDGFVDEDFLGPDGVPIGRLAENQPIETFNCAVPNGVGDCELGQFRCGGEPARETCVALFLPTQEICGAISERVVAFPDLRNSRGEEVVAGDEDCDSRIDEEQLDGPGADSFCSDKPNVIRAECTDGRCSVPEGGCDLDYYDVNSDGDDGCEIGCDGLPEAPLVGEQCNIAMYPDVDGANCQCAGLYGCRLLDDGRLEVQCRTLLQGDGRPDEGLVDLASVLYEFTEDPSLEDDNERNRCQRKVGTNAERCDSLDNDCNGQIDEPFTNGFGQFEGQPQGAAVINCGQCGTTCNISNGVPICESTGPGLNDFECRIAECSGTFDDCNADLIDGCESDTATDIEHCGACGDDCRSPRDAQGNPLNVEPDLDGEPGPDGSDGADDDNVALFRVATSCSPDLPGQPGECRCGGELACDPDGSQPFCSGEGGTAACVECRAFNTRANGTNPDCQVAAAGPFCFEGRCNACNPDTNQGCSLNDSDGNNDPDAQICRIDVETDRFRCQACEDDGQCTGAYAAEGLKYCHNFALNPPDDNAEQFLGCLSCIVDPINRPINAPDPGCDGNRPFCYPAGRTPDDGEALVRGECSGCDANSDCPSEGGQDGTCTQNEFGVGTCGTCGPAGDQGCGNPTPICDGSTFSCRPCNAGNPPAEECQDPFRRPVGDEPFKRLCVVEGGGQFGTCQQCVVDADCRDADLQQVLDDQGNPVPTTFDDSICCNFRCVPVDLQDNCVGCGVGCDVDAANVCDATTRSCNCGDNDACRGLRSFCDSGFGDGECVTCRDDVDCPQSTVCVDLDVNDITPEGRACRECDPRDNPGEVARDADRACAGANPICDLDTFACRGCRGDAECADGDQCLANGTCGQCRTSSDCTEHPDGNICVNGACSPCANDGTCHVHPDTLLVGNLCVTEAGRDVCRPCEQDQDCGEHPVGNRCVDGRCSSCNGNDSNCADHFAGNVCDGDACRPCESDDAGDCNGNPAGIYCNEASNPDVCANCRDFHVNDQSRVACDPAAAAPVCREDTGVCGECLADFECGALGVPNREICNDGSCHQCDPDDNRGCVQDANSGPICRTVPQDGDNTFCDDCQTDNECVGHSDGNLCVAGRCTTCASDSDCLRDPEHPEGNVCLGGLCGRCDDAGDCATHPAGNVCSGQGRCISCNGVGCPNHPNGTRCVVREDEADRGTCEECNPELGDSGCTVAAAADAPICDTGDFSCRPCASDAECNDASGGTLTQCVDGECQDCSPSENRVDGNPACIGGRSGFTCQASDADPAVFTCQECDADAECSNGQSDGACVSRGGRDVCVQCDPGANTVSGNTLCIGRQSCVDDACANCAPEANGAGGANATCAGGTCIGGACFGCDVALNDATGNPLCLGGPPGGARTYGQTCIAGDCAFCETAANNQLTGINPNCGASSCIERDLDGDGNDDGVCGACNSAGIDDDLCPGGTQCFDDGLCRQCRSDADCGLRGAGEVCDQGLCVACDDDLDCAVHPDGNVCDAGQCSSCVDTGCVANEGQQDEAVHPAGRYCDPDSFYCVDCTALDTACVDGGRESVCDGETGVCRSCRGDLECPDAQNPICITDPTQGDADVQICRICDPLTNRGCDEDSNTPRCRQDGDDTPSCEACLNDADCTDNPNGNLCNTQAGDGGLGTCEACDGDDDCQNSQAGNVCRAPFCSQCTRDSDCLGNPGGNVCNGGFCVSCQADNDCSDNPAGEECADIEQDGSNECVVCDPFAQNAQQSGCPNNLVCDLIENGPDAGTVQCVGCVNNNDCGAGRVCQNGGCFGDLDGDGVLDADDNCPADANGPDGGPNNQVDTDDDGDGDACDDDDDNDTIPDATEVANGSDPLDADTDDDTLDDAADNCPTVANGPNDADNQTDTDSDGDGDVCDPDDDNDGVADVADNCDLVINPDQANTDGDAEGNACDADDDNDGEDDVDDNCPLTENGPDAGPDNQVDTDGDGDGDVCDADDDADGVLDGTDNCPLTPNLDQLDTNGDTEGDACDADDDGDGVLDVDDNCSLIANPDQTNTDGDDEGNVCDDDDDNDELPDVNDNCPLTQNGPNNGPNNQLDTDVDGDGDVCDNDDDGDGVDDGADNCPLTANGPNDADNQSNTDGDAEGNACDDDDDDDTIDDGADNCPLVANGPNDADNQTDTDGDTEGDACDDDDDNDTVDDGADNCPLVANGPNDADNQSNTDGDAEGNACDDDDDDDTIDDGADNCPLVANGPNDADNQTDTDGDTEGDACDADDDNDTIDDGADNCPLVANGPNDADNQGNNDGDALGDICDPDDDNDGDDDVNDNCPLTANADQANGDGDLLGDACDNCPADDNQDQANQDGDALGDVCDPDVDGDGVNDDVDNCPSTDNANQDDADGDNIGDACERACAGDGDCDNGHLCDPGTSVCVQCVDIGDCGANAECRALVCNDDGGACAANGDVDCNSDEICTNDVCEPQQCDVANVDADCVGDPNGAQCVAGRCVECDQAADGNADCAGNAPICDVANACRACADNAECNGNAAGDFCNVGTGACVPCLADGDCPAQICENNACVDPECAIDNECAGNLDGEQCVVQRCEICDPVDDAGCGIGQLCVGAACAAACVNDGDCGANEICEGGGCEAEACDVLNGNADCVGNADGGLCVVGRCIECNVANGDADCAAGEICEAGVCEADQCDLANGDADCVGNPVGEQCVANRCRPCDVANANADCIGNADGTLCVANTCVECDVANGNADCAAGEACDAGTCIDVMDFCKLQFPVDLTDPDIAGGETTGVFIRIFEAGITDIDDGLNVDADIVVELGVGPDGSNPEDNRGWRWVAANGNALFDATGAGEPNNDEYEADLVAPTTTASFDFAARASADGGANYIYCDSDGGAYVPADAGQLDVDATELCGDDLDNNGNGDTDCDDADCGADPLCFRPPLAGELVITEVLFDPSGNDAGKEWVEALNVTDITLDLNGVELRDDADSFAFPPGTSVGPGAYIVFIADDDPLQNGGINGGVNFDGIAFNNNGDSVTLALPGPPEVIIDTIDYDAPGWPDGNGESIQLTSTVDPAVDDNDVAANWCLATSDLGFDDLGTPGTANIDCNP